MRLIDNQGVILHQHAILLNFSQQNTVGHQFDQRVVTHLIVKTNFIAHRAAKRRIKLMRDTSR